LLTLDKKRESFQTEKRTILRSLKKILVNIEKSRKAKLLKEMPLALVKEIASMIEIAQLSQGPEAQ
jgi:hypothetical protein